MVSKVVPLENPDKQLTPVLRFYNNANILVTGSTGFLGNILVEKILRSCHNVSTLYLLIRSKKGKTMQTRLEEIFDGVLFDRMKKECPNFKEKIFGIEGDCSLPDLGLSDQNKAILIEKVDIIFHVAATVRFDEKLKKAIDTNVRSIRDLLQLAHQMPNLKSFMHVSTAYSNCINDVIEEKIYPAAIDHRKLIRIAENLPEDILDAVTPTLIGRYPNTYTYSKQVAESVLEAEGKGLPIGVFSPSIVVSTYKEPVAGWINNYYGPTGVIAAFGLGIMRALHADPQCNANMVPVDMCVNALIAQAWDVGTTFEKIKEENDNYTIPVCTYESSTDKPINWGIFMTLSHKVGVQVPPVRAIWYILVYIIKDYPLYWLAMFSLHIIPALITDGVLLVMGKSPRMMKLYSKIHKFSSVIAYFSTKQWTFKTQNVRKLVDKMTEEDKRIFFSDLKELDWNTFFQTYVSGIRVYLINDPLSTLPEGKKRQKRFYWIHQTMRAVAVLLLLLCCYKYWT